MAELSCSIYEFARNEKMVAPKDGKPYVRNAVFLKPCVKSLSQAVAVPNTPLLFDIMSESLREWPKRLDVKGLYLPQKRWEEWIDRMAGKYARVWYQTGICDAILSSRYEIRGNKDLILGLLEFWCPETNTFVFPWGEATITLEDVMILGGLSPVGHPVTSPLKAKMLKAEEALSQKRRMMGRSRSKKATHGCWIKHFMEEDAQHEHEAFLSLWLSRYVLPSLPEEVIKKHVFRVAIHLSSGKRIALAPAVLASLYRNLTLLKEQAMSSSLDRITASGPLQLLHLWAFERFPSLGPSMLNTLKPGEPRAARFHRLNAKINLPLVRSVLRLADNFVWRPYVVDLKNWNHPSYYKDNTEIVSSSNNIELQPFARCLQASMLVGITCEEMYLPHRVAMQFGYDQDLPSDPFDYNISHKNVKFILRSRSFEAGVSARYVNWWNKCKLARKEAVEDVKRNWKKSSESVIVKRVSDKYPVSFGVSRLQPKVKIQECYSSFTDRHPPAYFKTQMNEMMLECESNHIGSNEESHASVIHESEDSSETDHMPLSLRLKQIAAVERRRIKPQKRFSSLSIDGSGNKKKFRTGLARGKATVHTFADNAKERQRKAGDFATKLKRTVEEGGKACDHARNHFDIYEHQPRVDKRKTVERKGEETMVEGCFKSTASSIQNFGTELEGRLMRLEKMMGMQPK
ncbi:hypothetical protein SLEP1_g49997 [Rubroshorea leprosula]|uniref:Aminotransferase-like plant mobile domain-containing protein n=1 Tax=Rubroshorea leprosula TaxID=152421 RepID=A0AAV5LZX4_9ROSI|nr:hypothetical protein SLEP1_g49997 [Rubroshorea leprosula]